MGGKPVHKPTATDRRQVVTLCGSGVRQKTIAATIGVALVTLRKHYAHELEHGTEIAGGEVADFLFRKATGKLGNDHGAVTAAIFWTKARLGWKDRHDVVHQNPDGTGLFEDWPADKLAAVARRAAEVLSKKRSASPAPPAGAGPGKAKG